MASARTIFNNDIPINACGGMSITLILHYFLSFVKSEFLVILFGNQ